MGWLIFGEWPNHAYGLWGWLETTPILALGGGRPTPIRPGLYQLVRRLFCVFNCYIGLTFFYYLFL
jgi:hypothetical protein